MCTTQSTTHVAYALSRVRRAGREVSKIFTLILMSRWCGLRCRVMRATRTAAQRGTPPWCPQHASRPLCTSPSPPTAKGGHTRMRGCRLTSSSRRSPSAPAPASSGSIIYQYKSECRQVGHSAAACPCSSSRRCWPFTLPPARLGNRDRDATECCRGPRRDQSACIDASCPPRSMSLMNLQSPSIIGKVVSSGIYLLIEGALSGVVGWGW